MDLHPCPNGNVKIVCQPDTYSAEDFCVTLKKIDEQEALQKNTDPWNRTFFQIKAPGVYCIRVQPPCGFFPIAQYRWVTLCPNKDYTLFFVFHLNKQIPEKADFTIRVSDQHYLNIIFEGVTFNLGF